MRDLPARGDEDLPFVWASSSDPEAGALGPRRVEGVRLRIVPTDRFGAGGPVDSSSFTVANNSLPIAEVIDGDMLADKTNEIPIAFSIRDADGHDVDAIVQFALAGEDFPPLPLELARPEVRSALLADRAARERYRIATVAPLHLERRVSAAGEPASPTGLAQVLEDPAAPLAALPPGADLVFAGAGFSGSAGIAGIESGTGPPVPRP